MLMLDQTGNAEVYFEYKATMRPFHKEMVQVIMNLQDKKKACEAIRHSLVYSMRCGDRFVIFVDKLVPDFKNEYNFTPDHWPSYDIFDFEKWRDNSEYMKVVKEDENHDLLLNPKKYFMNDNF